MTKTQKRGKTLRKSTNKRGVASKKAASKTSKSTYTPKMPTGFTSEQFTYAKRYFARGWTAKETYEQMSSKYRKLPTQSAVSHAWIGYKRTHASS